MRDGCFWPWCWTCSAAAFVGWSLRQDMRSELVVEALRMAWLQRAPGRHGQLLFPSDQGSQYASDEFHQVLRQCGIKPSMSRKGNCWDNACAETLFASLKVERLHGRRFQTARQAKDETLDWLLWYNQKRLHSTLHYVSPMQFEQEWKCPVGSHPTLNECVQRTGYGKAGKPKTLSNFPTATTTTL